MTRLPPNAVTLDAMILGTDADEDQEAWSDLLASPGAALAWRTAVGRRGRIDAFALDQWKDGQRVEFARGTSIGHKRLVRTEPVTTTKLRLRITQAAASPALAQLGVFAEPRD